ncbi:hypothetical protein BDM02DRAFT_2631056 [Thelephora ganbajun]|uniref:Uncharacterized protein n=1 Tax=Thelephora ganbajun TaxID=370292 RepID=A0ACB6ZTB0_THEGA|nr:hypothetical protein BDM02DRAFT_2631056 [Thelephora ganbajun]
MHGFMTPVSLALVALCSALLASAKTMTIVVGGNGTNKDASLIFQPQEVKAAVGDFVVFNFTNGTHSAIESTFAEPCIPAHDSNTTLNGFYSGLRDTVNGSAQTTLVVEIKEEDQNKTFWFYDIWGCGKGGVGAINANDSDWENFDAFVRNAKRLNGSSGGTSSSRTSTGRPTNSQPVPTSTGTGNSAERVGANTVKAISIFTPFLLAMFVA